MNRSQGLFAGTFLAAAFLLHLGGRPLTESRTVTSQLVQGAPGLPQGTAVRSDSRVDGPWVASCHYWAPTQGSDTAQAADPEPDSTRYQSALPHDQANIEADRTPDNPEDDRECGSELDKRWGIPVPDAQRGESPQVTTVIALVPDPVHTHLSLGFDRTVQVLLQAAADNGYLSSYYWLPWRASNGPGRADGSAGQEAEYAAQREHQPGLMILKHNSDPAGDANEVSLSSSYYDVTYVFLVAETPTEGVDGFQLQNALSYERQIRKIAGRAKENSSTSSIATIIGPTYSGSAASLRAAIEQACPVTEPQCPAMFDVFGITETVLAVKELMSPRADGPSRVDYYSFAAHVSDNMSEFLKLTVASGYDPAQIAVLSEDDTVYGSNGLAYRGRKDRAGQPQKKSNAEMGTDSDFDPDGKVLYMRFPREISALRNAPVDTDPSSGPLANVPSPYLHFSVKDSSGQDSVVQLSREQSPLSQESQLMAIARELSGRRIKIVAISASDPLDEIFLARFFHRACPDARMVFVQSDLLMARDGDVLPYVGSITVSPYSFMTRLFRTPEIGSTRIYANTASEAYYNAASFAFWKQASAKNAASQSSHSNTSSRRVPLEGYRFSDDKTYLRPPALWAMTLGSDGYYPLGLVHPCPNNPAQHDEASNRLFPQIQFDDRNHPVASALPCDLSQANSRIKLPVERSSLPALHPAFQWEVLCIVVAILCIFHGVSIYSAQYDSSLTHDLDVQNNDQPHRRSLYVRFSTATLFSMAMVLIIPLLVLELIIPFCGVSLTEATVTFLSGLFALRAGFSVTKGYGKWHGIGNSARTKTSGGHDWANSIHTWFSANVFSVFNVIAWAMVVLIPALWTFICLSNTHRSAALRQLEYADLAGLCFAFRCLHPFNGVSPVLPVLLLLLGWYLWGLFQTWRMYFSNSKHPRLPHNLDTSSSARLYVSEDDLTHSDDAESFGLYKQLGCLLITRGLIRRILNVRHARLDLTIAAFFVGMLGWFSFASPFRSIDHFMWSVGSRWSCPYEILLGSLFFPLFWCSFSGALRLILVWTSLKKELLVPLENLPIRFAFSRLQEKGWMTVLSRVGMAEQGRDLGRCVESMRQMLHLEDLKNTLTTDQQERLKRASHSFLHGDLRPSIQKPERQHNFAYTEQLEKNMAVFSEELLSCVLIPFWENERTGLVESNETESLPPKGKHPDHDANTSGSPAEGCAGPGAGYPQRILAAEEFLAMRYMTLIRAVLGNMQHMMLFFSITFVLTIVAWNSYPFQPREMGDWLFTALLSVLSLGVIWIFAQMHRDPILSRVTATHPNELGWDFYMRIISFGAVPILTWLAYHFPSVGAAIFSMAQPGSALFK